MKSQILMKSCRIRYGFITGSVSWICIILLTCPVLSSAQDSLLLKLNNVTDPQERISTLIELTGQNIYNNPTLADSCASLYISSAIVLKNDSLYTDGLGAKATVKLVQAQYDSVYYYTDLALNKISQIDYPLTYSKIIHIRALTHYYQGNYEKSLEENFKNLKIRESLSRPDLQLISLTNIAISYERLGDYDNAISYNDKALYLIPKDDIYSKATIENNIANILIRQSKFSEALEKFKAASESATTLNNKALILDTNIGIVESYIGLKKYQVAIPYANEAIRIGKEINNKASLISALNIRGELNTEIGSADEAIPLLNRALEISIDSDIKENRVEVYTNLASAYQQLNNYEESNRMKDSIISMKNKLYSEEKTKIAKELNIKYETAKKDILLKENEIKQFKQKQHKILLSIGAISLLLLSLFLYAYMRNRIKSNKKISEQELEIKTQRIDKLEKENKILGMSSMIEGQESERKRIAQDLHDGLGGLLATIKVKFGIIQKEIAALESLNVYQQTSDMIDDACSEVRKIAHNMMPDALTQLGLAESVKDIADQYSSFKIKVIDLGLGTLSETQQIMLYRVIQEFLNNTRKHADASQVIIQFSADKSHNHIYLEDDGKGYDPEKLKSNKGLGLQSIESRINFIGGHMEIDSTEGVGTSLHIDIPKI